MRIASAAALALLSYLFGTMLADCENQKIKAIDSLVDLLSYMRRRIYGERMPLCRVFAEYRNEYLEGVGFLSVLRGQRSGFQRLWNSAIGLINADEEILRELYIFGDALGTLELEEQIKRIDICLEALRQARDEAAKAMPQKKKSIKTVCLLIGLLTAIILL